MRKLALALVAVAALSGSAFAVDMAGKTGLGIRSDSFDVRHFVSNSFAMDIGGSYTYAESDSTGISDAYDLMLGGFWNHEIYPDIMLQAGALLLYSPGRNGGVTDKFYGINPLVGGEIIIKDHFGFDFKVIPFAFQRYDDGSGSSTKTVMALTGSVGAHIYF